MRGLRTQLLGLAAVIALTAPSMAMDAKHTKVKYAYHTAYRFYYPTGLAFAPFAPWGLPWSYNYYTVPWGASPYRRYWPGAYVYRWAGGWYANWRPYVYWDYLHMGGLGYEPEPLPPLSIEWRQLGDGYYHTGKYAFAREAYQRALGLSDANMHAWAGATLVLLSRAQFEAAGKLVPRILHRTHGLRRLQAPFGQLDKDAKRFVAEAEAALRKQPDNRSLHMLTAFLHAVYGSPLRSWNIYRQLSVGSVPAQDVANLGRLLREEWGFGQPRVELATQRLTPD